MLLIGSLTVLPTACAGGGGTDRVSGGRDRLEVPDGGAEPTTPATSVPEPPSGRARASARWSEGRADQTAELDDAPSTCRVEQGPAGWTLVVEIGPEEPGPDRASDALRLRVGPLAHLDQAASGADGSYLADVESIDLHVGGGDPPTGEAAADGLASVSADLSTARMPLGDGSLEVVCGP